MAAHKDLPLDSIRIDGGTQMRAQLSEVTVEDYAENVDALPPATAFFDGSEYWLADGFHRYHAHRKADRDKMRCAIINGTLREAKLYAVGANADHGLRRTNADKRLAVMALLNDKEWAKKSDRWIAEKCGVSNNFVGEIRRQLSSDDSSTRIGRDGKERSLPAKLIETPMLPLAAAEHERNASHWNETSEIHPAVVASVSAAQERGFSVDDERFRAFGAISELRKKWPEEHWPEFIQVLETVIEETQNAMC